jgi:hypothetical protein
LGTSRVHLTDRRRGNRIVQIGRRTGVDEGAAPVAVPGEPRQVTKDDLDQSA